MGNSRIFGPICGNDSPLSEDGTLLLSRAPQPGTLGVTLMECVPKPVKPMWHSISVPGGFPPSSLAFSPSGIELLKGIEHLRLKPYSDTTGDEIKEWNKHATIGYGHLIKEEEWNTYKNGFTEPEASALYEADSAPFVDIVRKAILVGLQQYEFDALVILAFNIGDGKKGLTGSSVAKLINDPKAKTPYASLQAAWMAWNTQGGKVVAGLTNRRTCEWNIYTCAIYKRW